MEKYKDIFKSWIFWSCIIFSTLGQRLMFSIEYGEQNTNLVTGLFLGSFISMTIIFSIFFFLIKLIKKIFKKA